MERYGTERKEKERNKTERNETERNETDKNKTEENKTERKRTEKKRTNRTERNTCPQDAIIQFHKSQSQILGQKLCKCQKKPSSLVDYNRSISYKSLEVAGGYKMSRFVRKSFGAI